MLLQKKRSTENLPSYYTNKMEIIKIELKICQNLSSSVKTIKDIY